ncbi:hypothetical protein Tco_0610532 [Tanacetum coccineum]
MLTKPQFFYDHTTKQALGFQNPFYLKKAQQLEPKLYDGNVIKNTSAIVIPDSEETLMLAEESHSKMLLKQKDPMMLEKKVNTTLVDYNSVNSPEPTLSSRPTKVEVPKELPKVSMVNTSLKKLKYHLAYFNVVVKKRTTATAITEGSWGFEHTKACFRDEISSFVKALKDLFNTFDQYLIDELSEVQHVFHQMEQAVEQHPQSQEKDTVIKKLKERIKSLSRKMNEDKIKKDLEEIETINIELDHKSVEISDLNASLQEKVLVITALKDDLRKLKGKALVDNAVMKHTIDSETLKIDVEPITPKLLNKKTAHSAYIKHTQEEAAVLRDLGVRPSTSASGLQPSDNTKKDKIQQTPSNTTKNKVEAHPRTCNGCMLSENHDLCVLDFINNVNARVKSKFVKKILKRKVWKPTGKVFTNIRYTWRPTGQTFTIVGNACPLTSITTTTKVPLRKLISLENETPKPVVTLIYSRKPRKSKTNVPVRKSKVLKSVSANKKEPSQSWGSIVSDIPSSSLDECRKGLKGQKRRKTSQKPTRNERDKKKSEETAKIKAGSADTARKAVKGQHNEAKDH